MKAVLPNTRWHATQRRGSTASQRHAHADYLGTSTVFSPWASSAALGHALETLTADRWNPVNDYQRSWIAVFEQIYGLTTGFSETELVRTWGKSAAEINQFMARRGFREVKLGEFARNSIGVATMTRIPVKWQNSGVPSHIGEHHAAHLKRGIITWKVNTRNETIVQLGTESGDQVFLSMENRNLQGFELWLRVLELSTEVSAGRARADRFNEVKFPVVHFDQFDEGITSLTGLFARDTGRRTWTVAQARQKFRFMMNHVGAKFEGDFAHGTPEVLVIDRPFILWMERQEIPVPIMAARFCPDSWRDPGAC